MVAFVLLLSAWLSINYTETPPIAENSVSTRVFAVNGSGLQADYYNGMNFEEKVFSRIEKQIDFWWLGQSPAPGVHMEDFSTRWTGRLFAPATGVYKFIVRADDGVRVWLGSKLILDEWHLQQETLYARKVQLQANRFYDLKVEYYNHELHAVMQLYWEEPPKKDSMGITTPPRIIIPQKYLFGPTDLLRPATTPVATKKIANKPVATTPPKKQKLAKATPKPMLPAIRVKPADLVTRPAAEETFEELKAGKAIVLNNVLFEQSEYVLLKESYEELNKLLNTLKKYPSLRIEITGHTDNMGDPRLNLALSENRAKVVASYLIRHGIDENRVEAKGYGSTRPVADNTVEAERTKNRRVEFIVK